MTLLLAGLVLFLGSHSLRMLIPGWRTRIRERRGDGTWKGPYAIAALAGFVLIIWGFRRAGDAPELLYSPPQALRPVTAALTLLAFILFAASHAPRNHIKAAIGHPMVASVTVWSFGHLLATAMLRDVVLFGAFFLWSAANFLASHRRDARLGTIYPQGTAAGTASTIGIGVIAWAAFAFWLHVHWIGVDPLR
jgi:uncharacterized membrane protein